MVAFHPTYRIIVRGDGSAALDDILATPNPKGQTWRMPQHLTCVACACF